MDIEDWITTAIALAEELARLINDNLRLHESAEIARITTDSSPVYNIDTRLEGHAINYLRARNIPAILRTEDSGVVRVHPQPVKAVLLDPLDGSTNAVRKLPFYCVSVAVGSLDLQSAFLLDSVEIAAIKDVPQNRLYTAIRGEGSFVDGRRISASECVSLGQALLASSLKHAPDRAIELANKALSVRANGASALDLCYLAQGTYDCFVDTRYRLRPTDVAAGALIAREAGCLVDCDATKATTNPESERVSVIASATLALHERVRAVLAS